MVLSRDSAELIGLQAVAWLASNDELRPVFLGATGASESDFRAGLEDPEFQGAVLDFILMDDAWVAGFCEGLGLDLSQMQPQGVGIAEPFIAKPSSVAEAGQNMRVEFRLIRVSAEVTQESDFDF